MAVEKSRRWEQVLVLTTRKGFWASERRALFPNVIYSPQRFGHSNSWANSLLLFVQALWCIVSHKPRLLLFGSAHRVAKWFLWLRHRGLFRKVKLVCHNMVFFWTGLAVYADRIIVFSSVEAEYFQKQVAKQGLYQFIPLPADGEFTIEQHPTEPPYIFSGGGTRRDFATAIEAVRGLPVHLKIRCHSPEKLNYSGDLPENVTVGYKVPLQDFLQEMNDALFVVVPLEKTELPHGHTTVAQAMRLGKAVITTRGGCIEDYVADGETGLLVEPNDVADCRRAILDLLEDEKKRETFGARALEKGRRLFTYDNYLVELSKACEELLR